MNDPAPMGKVRQLRKSARRTRWLLVGLSTALAVVLIANGAVVVGAIIGVMAVVRAAMLTRFGRNADQLQHTY